MEKQINKIHTLSGINNMKQNILQKMTSMNSYAICNMYIIQSRACARVACICGTACLLAATKSAYESFPQTEKQHNELARLVQVWHILSQTCKLQCTCAIQLQYKKNSCRKLILQLYCTCVDLIMFNWTARQSTHRLHISYITSNCQLHITSIYIVVCKLLILLSLL